MTLDLSRVTSLPSFFLSVICTETDACARQRRIESPNQQSSLTYHYKPFVDEPSGVSYSFKLFPVVLNSDGSPWAFACLYIFDRIEADIAPNMETYKSIATDLRAFRVWLDENVDTPELFSHFPRFVQGRVTYRYAAYLRQRVMANLSETSTSERRFNNVIRFYSWLIEKNYLNPMFSPWEEKTITLKISDQHGVSFYKKIKTTNLSLNTSKLNHTFDDFIEDGGKLRPLTQEEQRWVFDSLNALGNIEMNLILLVMLLTGARIQTVCTFQIGHFTNPYPKYSSSIKGLGEVIKLKAGPGTGIDTKFNKSGVLMIPRALYQALHHYAISPRVRKRSALTELGWDEAQYLFLTQQGSPYYESRADIVGAVEGFDRHHFKKGETIRQYLKEQLIPYVQKKFKGEFSFRVHDLRATFGMNVESRLVRLVHEGKLTMDKARQILATLMWHSSSETTDKYLNYRLKNEEVFAAVNEYGEQVLDWIRSVGGEI